MFAPFLAGVIFLRSQTSSPSLTLHYKMIRPSLHVSARRYSSEIWQISGEVVKVSLLIPMAEFFAVMWAEKHKHFRDFVWSFQFNSPPAWHAWAWGAREREASASVFTLIPSDSSLSSTRFLLALAVTLFCHPWIINPSFLRSPQWPQGLWALLSNLEVEKFRSLGIYPSCYSLKDKTSFDLSFRKLIMKFQPVVE